MQRQRNDVDPGMICAYCKEDMYFSGCAALTCDGWGCPDCGTGCDLDFTDEDGICETEIREHKESGHSDATCRATDDYIGEHRVYVCQCGEKILEIDGYGFRELSDFEKAQLRQKQMSDLDVRAL